ncbi:MAG: hypothetical protein DCC59_01770 [Chloroflexi bacterium]|nr:hypothetical protein [Anaerolineales bacterium]RIK55112.1 MAG: hypothetical protein DCC59_01770 [Chloroflexota bacterium]
MFAFILSFALFLQDASVAILAPQPGETLRGLIQIQGRMDSPEFSSAELAFTFDASASDPAAGWFVIQTFSQPTANPIIAEWDTTAVTDGDYALRLRLTLKDGSFQDALINDLRIRNDDPLPTATPPPTLPDFDFQPPGGQPAESAEATPTLLVTHPTGTPLPVNPASLPAASIFTVFWQSASVVLILFAVISLLLRLRKN